MCPDWAWPVGRGEQLRTLVQNCIEIRDISPCSIRIFGRDSIADWAVDSESMLMNGQIERYGYLGPEILSLVSSLGLSNLSSIQLIKQM